MIEKVKLNVNVKYSLIDIEKNYKEKIFRIPKYQRGYVWKEEQVSKLVDSLLRGYPLGSIIIWVGEDNKKYILDGQQRTRSLLEIRKYPFKFLSEETFEELFDDKFFINNNKIALNSIHNYLKDKTIDELYIIENSSNKMNHIDRSLKTIETNAYTNEINLIKIKEKINEYIDKLYRGDEKDFFLHSIEILNSSEKDAIEIFNRLNSQGVNLTRIEELSAWWSNNNVVINNKDLLEIIKNIYIIDGSEDIRDIQKNTPIEIVWCFLLKSFENTKFFSILFTEKIKNKESLKINQMDKLLWIIRALVYKYKNKENKNNKNINLSDEFNKDVELGSVLSKILKEDEPWFLNAIKLMNKSWLMLEEKMPILFKKFNNEYIFNDKDVSKNLFISIATQLFMKLLDDDNYELSNKIQYIFLNEIFNNEYSSVGTTRKTIESLAYINKLKKNDDELKQLHISLKKIDDRQIKEVNAQKGFILTTKIVIIFVYNELDYDEEEKIKLIKLFNKKLLKKKSLQRGQNSIGNHIMSNKKANSFFGSEELINNDKIIYFQNFNFTEYKNLIKQFENNMLMSTFEKILKLRSEAILNEFIRRIQNN
ncbi:MAG: hypothetical protein TYPL_1830 [Candidatus Tyloplasma litorale]|nr:MAG: hypothetical protein TYPL_1830 [Mycoplasmatales bacterium]